MYVYFVDVYPSVVLGLLAALLSLALGGLCWGLVLRWCLAVQPDRLSALLDQFFLHTIPLLIPLTHLLIEVGKQADIFGELVLQGLQAQVNFLQVAKLAVNDILHISDPLLIFLIIVVE